MNDILPPSPTSTAAITWIDDFLLGHGSMDKCHEDFVQTIACLHAAQDDALIELYPDLLTHLESHFDAENKLMVETEFPPRQCHIDEHNAVLNSVRQVAVELQEGNTALCRRLLEELSRWFPKHTQHLDSALAHWDGKSRLGGKPIIIKRHILRG